MFSFLTADKAATADAPAAVVNAFSAESQQKFAKQERPAEPVSRKRSAEEKAAAEASEKKRKPRKPKKEPPSAEELEARALKAANAAPDLEVFVGNLPLTTKPKELEKLFKEYGDVVSVRLRSLPVAGTAVDVNGDMNLMKKVCAYRGKLSDAKDSVNAYVKFSSAESATAAVAKANGMVMGGHTLRVDSANRGQGGSGDAFDAKRSVFLGNLPLKVTEDAVRKHFEAGLKSALLRSGGAAATASTDDKKKKKESTKDGEGDEGGDSDAEKPLIEGVRVIRDAVTHVGKGFGYVLLRDRATAAAALALHGSKLIGRELRVQVCGKRFKGRRGEEESCDEPPQQQQQPVAKRAKKPRHDAEDNDDDDVDDDDHDDDDDDEEGGSGGNRAKVQKRSQGSGLGANNSGNDVNGESPGGELSFMGQQSTLSGAARRMLSKEKNGILKSKKGAGKGKGKGKGKGGKGSSSSDGDGKGKGGGVGKAKGDGKGKGKGGKGRGGSR